MVTGEVVDLVEEDREDTSRLYQLNLSEHSAANRKAGSGAGRPYRPGSPGYRCEVSKLSLLA